MKFAPFQLEETKIKDWIICHIYGSFLNSSRLDIFQGLTILSIRVIMNIFPCVIGLLFSSSVHLHSISDLKFWWISNLSLLCSSTFISIILRTSIILLDLSLCNIRWHLRGIIMLWNPFIIFLLLFIIIMRLSLLSSLLEFLECLSLCWMWFGLLNMIPLSTLVLLDLRWIFFISDLNFSQIIR